MEEFSRVRRSGFLAEEFDLLRGGLSTCKRGAEAGRNSGP